jgi:flagellar protein FlaI
MSILFVGGTASGKTTTLNAVSLFIPQHMKIVSIEETRELNLPHPNWIPGCTREGFGGETVGGRVAGEVNMYDLLKAALRERPEYIIVGEIRGNEAYVLFQAMATGHTTYSTMHADSVPGLIHRLENKPIDIPRVMIPSLDGVCIQIQTRVGGRRVRRIKQIVEIIGLDPHSKELLTNEVFRWVPAIDDFEFSGKSYLLEKIMVKANLRKDELMAELKRRQAVMEWLVLRGIRRHDEVARVIAEYQTRPEEVLEKVARDLGKEL